MTQPAIYFGELPNDHVFVKTKTEEFDYPRGDANVFRHYNGSGGVPLSNVFRRLMFAIRFRSTDTFFSPNLTEESRVHDVPAHRASASRASRRSSATIPIRISPSPTAASSGCRTPTRHQPLSVLDAANREGLNYIRNSIKVTIDAYDGTTTFHLVDTTDPMARHDWEGLPQAC